jgi:hypothetical protein
MSEDIKHTTPGPWIVGVGTINVDKREHIGVMKANDHTKIIALTGFAGAPDENESIANAALIAAAPDMLDVLIAVHEELNTSKDVIDLTAINEMISGVFAKLANEAGEEM